MELFPNDSLFPGWLVYLAVWLIQSSSLVLAVFGQIRWRWRLMFAVQILLTAASIMISHYYLYCTNGWGYVDDCAYSSIAAVVCCIILFTSWVFWMNRKS